MNQQPTRMHILESTIEAIEKYGPNGLTTRNIAEEAGVNNAALHYYFGTKEKLLEEALAYTLEHWMKDTGAILISDLPVEERVRAIFAYMLDGVQRYPNLIRAHLQGPLMEGNPNSGFVHMLETWMNESFLELAGDIPLNRWDGIRYALHAAISSILFAGLLPTRTEGEITIDLQDEKKRLEYIDCLVRSVVPTE